MCRRKQYCSELGKDPARWDRRTPLRTPAWISDEVNLFISAVDSLVSEDRESCIQKLEGIRDDDITDWYIEHGQMSGMHRNRILNIAAPPTIESSARDPLRSPAKLQQAVFERDNYQCRYCGNRVISQDFLKHFITVLSSNLFTRGSTNLTTHGIIHMTWPVADHVVPWNKGGQTNLQNLVTSCASCNYGKDGYTLEQLGLDNPFDSDPVMSNWIGLKNIDFRAVAALADDSTTIVSLS